LSRPDALLLPPSVNVGPRIFERVSAVSRVAEPLLEVDYDAGERAYIRKMPETAGRKLFITRDPLDTMLFPTGHPRSGEPRYRWEKRPDGSEVGYLVDGAAACAK
jgi:hypothetical protein